MTYLVYRLGFEACKDLQGHEWKRRREVVEATGLSFRMARELCKHDHALHMLRERETETKSEAAAVVGEESGE